MATNSNSLVTFDKVAEKISEERQSWVFKKCQSTKNAENEAEEAAQRAKEAMDEAKAATEDARKTVEAAQNKADRAAERVKSKIQAQQYAEIAAKLRAEAQVFAELHDIKEAAQEKALIAFNYANFAAKAVDAATEEARKEVGSAESNLHTVWTNGKKAYT